MTATMGTLLSRTRDRLNEPTAAHWTDIQLRRWINEGAREVARESECLPATGTIAIVAGTRQYAASSLTPQPLRIHRVTYTATGDGNIYPLEYRDLSAMDQVWGTQQASASGTPSYWTAWGYFPSLNITLYPTPQSSGTLTLYYYRNPTALAEDGTADSTVVDVPDGFEDLIVDYAEYSALRNDNRPNWTEAQQLFNQRLQALINITTRPSDGLGLIVSPMGGFVPGWLANPDY